MVDISKDQVILTNYWLILTNYWLRMTKTEHVKYEIWYRLISVKYWLAGSIEHSTIGRIQWFKATQKFIFIIIKLIIFCPNKTFFVVIHSFHAFNFYSLQLKNCTVFAVTKQASFNNSNPVNKWFCRTLAELKPHQE